MKTVYGHNFYQMRHQNTVYSANKILTIVADVLPEISSAIDFGCGVGTWLSVLKERGVTEIQGIDGPWVVQDLLEIPRQAFRQANFEDGISLDKKYDLAITLEVAEHLPEKSAAQFIDSLVAASNFVLFSAAIPFQGGKEHVNEQWPDYWIALFNERGYVPLDIIREAIWNDEKIPIFYRQNIFLFMRKNQAERVKAHSASLYKNHLPISLVHPEAYLYKARKMSTVKGSYKLFRRAIKNWVREKIGNSR